MFVPVDHILLHPGEKRKYEICLLNAGILPGNGTTFEKIRFPVLEITNVMIVSPVAKMKTSGLAHPRRTETEGQKDMMIRIRMRRNRMTNPPPDILVMNPGSEIIISGMRRNATNDPHHMTVEPAP
jgi:hypothetical protein